MKPIDISPFEALIKEAYAAFNRRDIDAVLQLMHPEVRWPNGWEGGYVTGREEVRKYWTRQWKELDPLVTPIAFKEGAAGQMEVRVHQVAKDLQGKVLFDGLVIHHYSFENGLIKNMEIEEP